MVIVVGSSALTAGVKTEATDTAAKADIAILRTRRFIFIVDSS